MHIILYSVRLETIDLGQQTHQDSADLGNGSRKPSCLLLSVDPEELAPLTIRENTGSIFFYLLYIIYGSKWF